MLYKNTIRTYLGSDVWKNGLFYFNTLYLIRAEFEETSFINACSCVYKDWSYIHHLFLNLYFS